MLEPALVGPALDVEHDPPGLRVAVARAVPPDRVRVGAVIRGGNGRGERDECEERDGGAGHRGLRVPGSPAPGFEAGLLSGVT